MLVITYERIQYLSHVCLIPQIEESFKLNAIDKLLLVKSFTHSKTDKDFLCFS